MTTACDVVGCDKRGEYGTGNALGAEHWFCRKHHSEMLPHKNIRHPLSERFHAIIEELAALHDKKQADYGRETDPFANVRGSEDFGVRPWIGAMIRANDKVRRIQKAASGGALENESVVDSFNDLAVYAIIARILWEEENANVG